MSYWMEEAEEAEEHMTEVSNRILEPNAFQARDAFKVRGSERGSGMKHGKMSVG